MHMGPFMRLSRGITIHMAIGWMKASDSCNAWNRMALLMHGISQNCGFLRHLPELVQRIECAILEAMPLISLFLIHDGNLLRGKRALWPMHQ